MLYIYIYIYIHLSLYIWAESVRAPKVKRMAEPDRIVAMV